MTMPSFGGARPQGRRVKSPWGFQNVGGTSEDQWNAQGGFNLDRLRGASMQALQQGAGAAGMERKAVGAYQGYDPSAALGQYTQGVLGESSASLKQALADLTEQEAGGGRLHTGLYDEDKGKVATDIYNTANQRLQQGAFQAAGMQEQHLGNAAEMAKSLQDRYLGLVGDSYNRLYAEEQNKPKGGWLGNALGSLGGFAAGSFLGPLGAAAGSKLGAKLF